MGRLPASLTRAEVRAADARAVRRLGVPTASLMEHAGRGLSDVTEGEIRRYGLSGAVVLAARGNNGGDGLVAARLLRVRGIPVRVLLASPEASFAAGNNPTNFWPAGAYGAVTMVGATAGAIGGYAFGEWFRPTASNLTFLASATSWG